MQLFESLMTVLERSELRVVSKYNSVLMVFGWLVVEQYLYQQNPGKNYSKKKPKEKCNNVNSEID